MAEKPHTLFLLDGMALVYRAHFALIRSPIINSKRQNVSAVFGFLNTLLEILDKHAPTHIGVAFDTREPTPRHKLFPEYKAQREAMPEDLAAALPEVKRLLNAFHIPVIECPGYEADDIIGTLAKIADDNGSFHTYMVTPDKDFAQLVSDNTSMLKPGRKGGDIEILDPKAIMEKWEISRVGQVIDILALWGDASDNIPGVPGIGEKTAKKLIAQYDSVEGLLANTQHLKGKQKENVINNHDQALLSKELVTIITDAPCSTTFEDLLINTRDDDTIKSLLIEWEFSSIGKRLYGADFITGRGNTIQNNTQPELTQAALKKYDSTIQKYILINSQKALDEFTKLLSKQECFCFDVETTSLNPREAELLGIAFSWQATTGYYISCTNELTTSKVLKQLAPVFSSNKTKIGHNLKYDLSVLLNQGASVAEPFFDTMLAHSLTHPEHKHSMDFLAESILAYQTIKFEELIDTSTNQEEDLFTHAAKKQKTKALDMCSIPTEQLSIYACEDADITFQLAESLADTLENSGMQDIFYDIESPLLTVLVTLENNGISINSTDLAEISKTMETEINKLHASIIATAGKDFNLKSPKQLGVVLFEDMKLVEKPKTTKTGQFKTDEATLRALASKHTIIADILSYREFTKLKSTYVDALPTHQCAKDKKIHSHFHQLQTSTGRLACSDPNLQNIPVRSKAGKQIRKAFIPSAGCTFLSVDYSQIELRVMAAMANDSAMIQAFKDGLDIHTSTAAKVYGVPLSEVTTEMRRTAKMVNFGIIYGISAFGLSQRLEIPRTEAAQIIETYFEKYPAIKTFMETTINKVKETGVVSTLSGRKRALPDINSKNATIRNAAERAAINTPIQGTAADMIKLAMIKVNQLLIRETAKTKMLLQVHDELIFDLDLEEKDQLTSKIIDAMQSALCLPNGVPTKVDYGFGENWLAAH